MKALHERLREQEQEDIGPLYGDVPWPVGLAFLAIVLVVGCGPLLLVSWLS